MHEDQIRGLLRTLEDRRDPDPAFADALFSRLELVARDGAPRRSPLLLLAAALLLATLATAVAVGSGLVQLPLVVDSTPSPEQSASAAAVASPSASPLPSVTPEQTASASASASPETTVDLAGAVLFAEADGLRIRTEPSEGATVVTTIGRGQLVGATGAIQSAGGMEWYEVRLGPGDTVGWVASGADGEWLRLVGNGAVAFSCGGCIDPQDDPQAQDPVLVSVDPFGDTTMTTLAEDLTDWSWSPDGGLLAGTARSDEGTAVVVMRPDGSERREIGPGGYGPRWSPDGRLAWTTGTGVVVTDAALEPVGPEIALRFAGAPMWSPDSTRLALIALDCPACPVDEPVVGDVPQAAYVIDLATGEATKLTEPSYYDLAGWSPDGTHLSMSEVDLSGERPAQAFILDVADGSRQMLLDRAAVHGAASWSPDGTRLAMAAPAGILVATGDGSEAVVLVGAATDAFLGDVRWSPGGDWLAYTSAVGGDVTVWIAALNGDAPRQISMAGGQAGNAAWQPLLLPLP